MAKYLDLEAEEGCRFFEWATVRGLI